jgi:hypothetical protein
MKNKEGWQIIATGCGALALCALVILLFSFVSIAIRMR